MHLFFLVPLTAGLVSGYIMQKSADEMAYLTGTIAIVSLILSLIVAPWQLQLLILMLVIISTRRLLLLNHSQLDLAAKPEEQRGSERSAATLPSAPAKPMLMVKHSGVSHQPTPALIAATKQEITGKYRGSTWKVPSSKQARALPTTYKLKYRGSSFRSE